jgi:hypothetical protein
MTNAKKAPVAPGPYTWGSTDPNQKEPLDVEEALAWLKRKLRGKNTE